MVVFADDFHGALWVIESVFPEVRVGGRVADKFFSAEGDERFDGFRQYAGIGRVAHGFDFCAGGADLPSLVFEFLQADRPVSRSDLETGDEGDAEEEKGLLAKVGQSVVECEECFFGNGDHGGDAFDLAVGVAFLVRNRFAE